MPGVVEQNVLGLEISVDDVETMKTLECAEKLCSIEARSINVEALLPLQVVEQLSTVDKCEHKV